MRPNRTLVIVLILSVALAAACQRRPAKTEPYKMSPQFTIGVASFTVPSEPWQLPAGYLPERVNPPKSDALDGMDEILFNALTANPERTVVGGAKADSCMKAVRRGPDANRLATLKYWQEVGQCMGVQYLIVPMALHWKEREGSAAGSTSPAWVILDLYLINVKTGGLMNHYHYDYQQKALTDNILDAEQFLKWRGQWVTATELARVGIAKALKEFGL